MIQLDNLSIAMTLLRQIQIAAVSSDQPIADLLRLCKILAVRLRSPEFGKWVDSELDGYPPGAELPDYRMLQVQAAGHFTGPYGRGLKNAPIPPTCIPSEWRAWAQVAHVRQSVSACEDLLRTGGPGTFQAPWPPDLTAHVGEMIYEGLNCLSAWQIIPRGAIIALLDSVRNRVLNFVLEIEAMAPDAGEALPNSQPVPQERVNQSFQNHIYGNVGNIALGNQSVTQQANMMIRQGSFEDLASKLSAFGFEDEDINELQAAIVEDTKDGKKQIGSSIGTWLGKAIGKAGSGALQLTVSSASELLPKLLGQYLGLPA